MGPTTKAPRKRPASVQAGPKPKKAHVEKSAKPSVEKGKRRSQPITMPIQEIEDSDLEATDEGELEGQSAEVNLSVDEAPESGEAPTKDPNGAYVIKEDTRSNRSSMFAAARESHKAQRALLSERRAAKPHSALLVEAKRAWRLTHQKSIPKTEREKHLNELMGVIRGNVKDIVVKHDASRIVQTAVRYGGEKERNEVAEELKGHYKEMAQNKYSKVRLIQCIFRVRRVKQISASSSS